MTTIASELSSISVRTHRMMYLSAALHAALILWLIIHQSVALESEGLTEITFVEVAEPLPEPTAPPVATKQTVDAPAREVEKPRPSQEKPTEQFQRELVRSQVKPVPQKKAAVTDVLSSRLSSLQEQSRRKETSISQLVPPPNVGAPALAGVESDVRKQAAPTELERTERGRPAAVDLPRVATPRTQTAAMVPAIVPESNSSPQATMDWSSASRQLAGAELVGPVADRQLISHTKPSYPDWAKQDGVEASVTIYFLVLPDGRVKENVLVDKTSGFGDFDDNAVAAIRKWRFEAMEGTGEQWGSIRFNFRLTDGS